jgi:hypothetical protein
MQGHDESIDSENPGIFMGLVNFTKCLDDDFRKHIESTNSFKGTSKTVQNELLQCILDVCREEILKEIKDCEYVSIVGDETTDTSNQVQFALLVRYVTKSAEVHERFWGFFNPESQDAEGIANLIINELEKIIPGEPMKLVSQGYDGAAVMSGGRNGVQMKVKETYTNAHYVHCKAHQLNLVIQRACSRTDSSRTFFSNLNGIPAFFARSPKRQGSMDKIIQRRIPTPSMVRWNYFSRTVSVVHAYKEQLIECFQEIESTHKQETSIRGAHQLKLMPNNSDFTYWLNFYSTVMPHVDTLFNQLQSRALNVTTIQVWVQNFLHQIQIIREKHAVLIENHSSDIDAINCSDVEGDSDDSMLAARTRS